jgi:hypothetical protein
MVPNYAFELITFGRDGRVQFREFQNLQTAVEAAKSLRASVVRSYRLAVVIDAVGRKRRVPPRILHAPLPPRKQGIPTLP